VSGKSRIVYSQRSASVFCKSVINGLLLAAFTHSSSNGVHNRSEELSNNKIGVSMFRYLI
jgi:hypothetical protein